MHAHIRLGRILGTEIGLHYSWFVIALLITFSLAARFQHMNPSWTTAVVWGSAVVAGVLFFASLIVHELSHAAVARSRGIPVRAITLFALGGVAHIDKESADPRTEFWMGIVGPITSALIGALSLGAAAVLGWTPEVSEPAEPSVAILKWLGYINLGLAAFNLLPGFPLDGGRVLRAALWWRGGDQLRATRQAARVGQAVAFGLMLLGLFQFFAGAGGLWLAVIGWFLLEAAQASYAQVAATAALGRLRVDEVMSRDCPAVSGAQTLQQFVDDHLLRTGRRCFFVQDDGHVAGLITPHEVKEVDRHAWDRTTVQEAMRPLDRILSVAPDAPASEALEMLGRENVNQLPVMRDGRLEGVVSRGELIQVLQTRAELNM
jgi:Zn-dependent protease/predicted transcriptional regulator